MITAVEIRGARMAQIWIKIAVVYLLIGVIFGLVMGISHQFQYVPVHTHVNLLGWTTLGLAGVIYWLYPRAGGHWLGLAHFWLHNIGLPISVVGLFFSAGRPSCGSTGGGDRFYHRSHRYRIFCYQCVREPEKSLKTQGIR